MRFSRVLILCRATGSLGTIHVILHWAEYWIGLPCAISRNLPSFTHRDLRLEQQQVDSLPQSHLESYLCNSLVFCFAIFLHVYFKSSLWHTILVFLRNIVFTGI